MRTILYPHFVRATIDGGVPERFIGAVLKTVVRSNVPWVRIPPPPFLKPLTSVGGFLAWRRWGSNPHKTKFCQWV